MMDDGKFHGYYITNSFKKKEPDNAQETSDILTILTLVLTKGPKALTTGGRNVSAQDLSTINSLMAKYGIQKNASDKTTATLSRVVAAYAPYAFKLLVEEPNLHRPVSNSIMEMHGYTNFPTCLSGPFIFGMLVPNSNIKREVYAMVLAALHYMVEESFVFKGKKNPSNDEKNKEFFNSLNYARSRMIDILIRHRCFEELLNDNAPEKGIAETWINSFNKVFPDQDVSLILRLKICD